MFKQLFKKGITIPERVFFWLSILIILVVIKNAWISDDAYISFRVIDNFLNDYGLRWNLDDRVLVFTHPLWLFVVTFFRFFTREPYFTSIAISIALTFFTVYFLLFKFSRNKIIGILAALLLLSSRAFTDYSTSGLENPLSHLLIVIYFYIFFTQKVSLKDFLYSLFLRDY